MAITVVTIQWTGLHWAGILDWTTGLSYFPFGQVSVFVFSAFYNQQVASWLLWMIVIMSCLLQCYIIIIYIE